MPKTESIAPEKQWFTQRLRKLGISQALAASTIGVHQASLGRMLTAERAVSLGEGVALAKLLQVPLPEIARRFGFDPGGGLTPAGRILHDGRVSPVVENPSPSALGGYPVEAVALAVDASAGPLAPFDGAVVIYLPSTARVVGPEMVGRLCVIEDATHPLPVVGELASATGGRGNVARVWQTDEELRLPRLVRASPVLGIHLRA